LSEVFEFKVPKQSARHLQCAISSRVWHIPNIKACCVVFFGHWFQIWSKKCAIQNGDSIWRILKNSYMKINIWWSYKSLITVITIENGRFNGNEYIIYVMERWFYQFLYYNNYDIFTWYWIIIIPCTFIYYISPWICYFQFNNYNYRDLQDHQISIRYFSSDIFYDFFLSNYLVLCFKMLIFSGFLRFFQIFFLFAICIKHF